MNEEQLIQYSNSYKKFYEWLEKKPAKEINKKYKSVIKEFNVLEGEIK